MKMVRWMCNIKVKDRVASKESWTKGRQTTVECCCLDPFITSWLIHKGRHAADDFPCTASVL